MRLVFQLLLICLLAAGVGLGLTALAVRHPPVMNAIRDGAWVATANEGAPEVDAYTLAGLAHRGEAPLAISDGLTFRARHDDEGKPLNGRCSYVVSGPLPTVRLWSLAALDAEGKPFANAAGRFGFSSAEVLSDTEGAVRIAISAQPRAGNWLPVSPGAPIILVLRLYDTTAAAISGGRSAPELPAITPTGCSS